MSLGIEDLMVFRPEDLPVLVQEAEHCSAIIAAVRHCSEALGDSELATLQRMVLALEADRARLIKELVGCRMREALSRPFVVDK